VHTLFDVRDKKAVSEQINSLPEAFSQIDILINNNVHGLDPIQNGDLDDAMIDINVKGLYMFLKPSSLKW
jgi:NADP-dependent 3-hydroxy acid dehydrogenase YdfG